uniref:Uncharacterized protein n=1 Tax=Candidatus Kentrum sp. LPFa TaxID=2126335 RepID=A0A450WA41_9GAMM|nr:MAG: hypothetical protein BECKLPF1236B_GA0070989_105215 [Candidatus Kentron sp. LPFa]
MWDAFDCMLSLIYDETLIPFAFGCAITSVLFLIVDYAYFMAQGQKSLLNIIYRGRNFLLILTTWFLGAFVVGYFAAYIEMFDETSKLSLVVVGILWPVVLTKMITNAEGHLGAKDTGDKEPEEPVHGEEER